MRYFASPINVFNKIGKPVLIDINKLAIILTRTNKKD